MVKEWLAGRTLDAKLREEKARRRLSDSAELFHIVRKTVGVNYTKHDVDDKERELRERYQAPEFTQVDKPLRLRRLQSLRQRCRCCSTIEGQDM